MSGHRVQLDGFVERVAPFQKPAKQSAEFANNHVDQLHDGNWSGASASAHRAKHAEWTAAEVEMREAVGRLREAAATAHRNRSEAITANTAMWP